MPYCFNPACPNPENLVNTEHCQACGESLLLQGRFEAIRGLGQGGFGATFLAKNKGLPGDPQCVIKQLRPSGNAPNVMEMARDLFGREAKTLGKIGSHPQIPTLLDYFEERAEFYLVQEFVSGLTLQQEVRQNGPFTEAGAKQFLSEILPLIQYIHGQQVIHRDIKPANIIRRNQDRKLVLIDFGAVKDQVNPVAASASEQTALTSYAIGTPGYAPPEQMAMRPVYSSDIYALGVTCLFLLSGKAPKDFSYDPRTGEMQWRKDLDISDHFATVLAKMLDASVKHRYQMANDVLRALDMEPYLDSLAQSMIKPATTAEKTEIKPEGRRSRWGGGAVPKGGAGAGSGSADSTTGGSSRSRQVADIAERIRQRRQMGNPGGAAGGRADSTQVFASSRARSMQGGKSGGNHAAKGDAKPPADRLSRTRATAEHILSHYAKGIRDFAFHELSGIDLSKAILADGNFHDARFFKTNLQGADLTNSTLSKANFNQSILRDAILVRAYMNYTNLQNADLRGADLSYAHLSNANLKGANLSGANLTGAKVTEEQLAQAKTSWNTTLPNGKASWRQ